MDERSLDELMDVRPLPDGRYRFVVPDGWLQGRGAFGGFVIGAALRAVQHAEPDAARRVRSVTAEIPAPVLLGEAEIEVVALRCGAHVSTWRATMTQGGEVVAQTVAVLGGARAVDAAWSAAPPPEARWEDTPAVPYLDGVMPAFARAFEYRSVGPVPYGGGDEARAEGWVRPRSPCAVRDAAWVAALADAFWPALLARATSPRPTATVAFTLQLLRDPTAVRGDAPLRYRAVAPVLEEGYSVELRELWAPDGALLAMNQQTFVVVR